MKNGDQGNTKFFYWENKPREIKESAAFTGDLLCGVDCLDRHSGLFFSTMFSAYGDIPQMKNYDEWRNSSFIPKKDDNHLPQLLGVAFLIIIILFLLYGR